jgi:RNA polymerase sigma factor (TIGR02999 family)
MDIFLENSSLLCRGRYNRPDENNPVNPATDTDVTQLLQGWSASDKDATAELIPIVYQELRRLARQYLARERPDHTLQATALVHEAYLKLVDQKRVTWQSRAHFCAIAAELMRRILMHHARAHQSVKRGGKLRKLYLDETRELAQEGVSDLVELDDALKIFALSYPRESTVVELKFFGGMEAKEIAEVLNVSAKTVSRDWTFAKVWLARELSQQHTHA